MKAENYLTVQGWMYNLAGGSLSLPEILTYAVIYGFSQDCETRFTGSRSYLADLLRCSKNSVSNYLASLESKGLIRKEVQTVNGVDFNHYRAVLPGVSILPEEPAAPATAGGEAPAAPAPAAPATPARRARKASGDFDFRAALIGLGVSETTTDDWMRVRKATGGVNTETAFKAIVKEIGKTGATAEECIQLAVVKNWRGFAADWYINARPAAAATMLPARPQRVMRSIDEL